MEARKRVFLAYRWSRLPRPCRNGAAQRINTRLAVVPVERCSSQLHAHQTCSRCPYIQRSGLICVSQS